MLFWNAHPSVYLKFLLVVLIKWLYWLWERDATPLIVWLLFILYNICIFIIRLFLGRAHYTVGEDTYQYKKTWKFTDYLYDNEKKTLKYWHLQFGFCITDKFDLAVYPNLKPWNGLHTKWTEPWAFFCTNEVFLGTKVTRLVRLPDTWMMFIVVVQG